ncbi:MAG: zinc finger domain-containing protein [Methanomassiliicoccales archaeon]
MKDEKHCSSCGIRLIGEGIAYFPCPMCGEEEIGRCEHCRDQSIKYECSKCGFLGP